MHCVVTVYTLHCDVQLQDELAKLTQQLDDRNDEYGRLYHYCEEVLGEKAEVEGAAAGARQQLEALGAEAAELRRQVEALQAEVADKEAKVRGTGSGVTWGCDGDWAVQREGRGVLLPLGYGQKCGCQRACEAVATEVTARRRLALQLLPLLDKLLSTPAPAPNPEP